MLSLLKPPLPFLYHLHRRLITPSEVWRSTGCDRRSLRQRIVSAVQQIRQPSDAVSIDLRDPHQWYPMCRSIRRKIIYHAGKHPLLIDQEEIYVLGPTNSGKTYTALEKLKKCGKGLYCAPLRLLAMEVFDTLNRDGLYCHLITGQERKLIPAALHTASTVEMVNLNQHYEVAVIDEIQMMKDEDRGYAWTRALLGLPANELHLCGDFSVISLVKEICEKTNEDLEVCYYDRFTPLNINSEPIKSYSEVEPGDCVVAFSRDDIYKIKQLIEYGSNYNVCVVYGALPPEVRRQQALLFNKQNNGYDIMVASDAVGMGLNLNIKRIIFHTLSKYNGSFMEPISGAQIRQISGRAGRRNSIYPDGSVACLTDDDISLAQEALKAQPVQETSLAKAGIFPEFDQIEDYAQQLGKKGDLVGTLSAIEQGSLIQTEYFICQRSDQKEIAELIREVYSQFSKVPLSFRDRFYFSVAPVDTSNPKLMVTILEYANLYSSGSPVLCKVTLSEDTLYFLDDLKPLETQYQVVSLWLWLSFRFGEKRFPGREKATKLLESITSTFKTGLVEIASLRSLVSLDSILPDSETDFPRRKRYPKTLLPAPGSQQELP